jgi:hypothetical protein
MGRGQIAIFVIIGLIIILASIIIGFYFIPTTTVVRESRTLEGHVRECLEDTAVSGLEILGKQGSIYPKAYIASPTEKVSYYYFKGKSFLPDRKDMEKELQDYISQNIDTCIFDYKRNKFGISMSNISGIRVRMDKALSVQASYSMEADQLYDGDVSVNIRTSISELYGYAKSIVEETMKDPDWINLDALSESDVAFRIVKVDKSTLIYILTDEAGLEGEPYSLNFGMKYR